MNVNSILKTKEKQYITTVSDLLDILERGHYYMASFEFSYMLQNLVTSLSIKVDKSNQYVVLSHIDYFIPTPEYSYRINEQTFVITNQHKILYILYCFILSKGLENDIQIHL